MCGCLCYRHKQLSTARIRLILEAYKNKQQLPYDFRKRSVTETCLDIVEIIHCNKV